MRLKASALLPFCAGAMYLFLFYPVLSTVTGLVSRHRNANVELWHEVLLYFMKVLKIPK